MTAIHLYISRGIRLTRNVIKSQSATKVAVIVKLRARTADQWLNSAGSGKKAVALHLFMGAYGEVLISLSP